MKILVVGPSWVGDMVMSNSLYQELKQRYPNCVIDVLAPEWCKPLLDLCQKLIELFLCLLDMVNLLYQNVRL